MRPFRPDDLHDLRAVTDVAVHPDGGLVAFVVAWPDRDTDDNRTEIRLHDVAAGRSRVLTRAHRADGPRWSPDGRRLAYRTADHEARPRLAVLDLDGGEPTIVAEPTDGVSGVEWVDDDTLLFVAPVRPADQVDVDDDELARRPRVIEDTRYRFNGRGWTHDRRTHVFVVGLDGAAARQLTDGPVDDGRAVPSPDGRRVAFVSARGDDDELAGSNGAYVVDVAGGPATPVTPDGGVWGSLDWLDDGRLVLVGKTDAAVVALFRLHVLELDGGTLTDVDPDDVSRFNLLADSGRVIVRGDRLHALAIRRGSVHVDALAVGDGPGVTLVGGERQVTGFDVSADGRTLAAGVTTPTRPAELVVARIDGGQVVETSATDLNAGALAEIDVAEPEAVTVTSGDGHPVPAWIVRPPASAPGIGVGGPGPGLVYVHGGPLAQYGHGFFDEFQVAAATGYTVIAGNPRGSDGYGTDHAVAPVGDLGGLDWLDVQAITDALAGLDEVDERRIGIGGGSYGGFMTTWAVGHSDRYAAALSERAVNNWETMQGTSDIGPFFGCVYLGAHVHTDVEVLRRQSPITYAADIDTPMLLVHSEEDWRCPPEQAEQLFVALRLRGVPARFVRFPGENHELSRSGRPSHRVERFRIVHEWWAEHLGGAPIL